MDEMHQQRWRRAQQLLEAQGVDAVLAASPANVFYFTGVWLEPHERLLALVIPKLGDPVLLVPQMHTADVASVRVQTVTVRDGEPAAERLASVLPKRGTVAVDDEFPARHLVPLWETAPGLAWRTGKEVLGRLRRIKDAAEIERMREIGRRTDQVLARLRAWLQPGLSEREVAEALVGMWRAEGVAEQSFPPIIAAGPNGARPHHEPGDHVLAEDDVVIIDMGGRWQRYCSDVTRTFILGHPPNRVREVYNVVLAAQEAALRAVRPGVALGEIDRAAREVIEAAGYGPYFTHRTGHGLGIDIHEAPDVSAGSEERVEAGMVFSIEPGIYLEGDFGVRIEDCVVVTDDGCEPLTRAPKAWPGV